MPNHITTVVEFTGKQENSHPAKKWTLWRFFIYTQQVQRTADSSDKHP